jgi:cell wall-associated NlpC family hydrolase
LRFAHALRAFGLASIVAIGGITLQPTLVAATTPVPVSDPAPDPSASPTPAPTTAPAPTATPDPSATTSPDPSAPAPTPTPTPTSAPSSTTPPTTTTTPTTTVATRPRLTIRQRIVRLALAQRRDRYVSGAIGPSAFDCSGLVRYVYNHVGMGRHLGGGHSARMQYLWGRAHHLNSSRRPRIGDVAVWGHGRHVGIYIGNGLVISALNTRLDIRVTRVHALTDPFTTFIHTRLP